MQSSIYIANILLCLLSPQFTMTSLTYLGSKVYHKLSSRTRTSTLASRRLAWPQMVSRLTSNTPAMMVSYIISDIRGRHHIDVVNAYLSTFVKPGSGIGWPQSFTFPGFAI
ncbi:hypothetical protein D3C81_1416660 [compost metagenome]